MTAIPFKSTFQKLQVWDIRAGRIVGNADHVRAAGHDWFSYSATLGLKIVFIAIAASLLQLMLGFITFTAPAEFAVLACAGYALAIYMLAGIIHPDSFLELPMIIVLGLAPLAATDAVIRGMNTDLAWHVIRDGQGLLSVVSPALGCLFGLHIITALAQMIRSAFSAEEEPNSREYSPSFAQLRRSNVLTSDEAERFTRWRAFCAPIELPYLILALLTSFLGLPLLVVFNLPLTQLWAAIAVTFLLAHIGIVPVLWEQARIMRPVIKRLRAEGVLEPLIHSSTVRTTTETETGFILNGVEFPKGRTPKALREQWQAERRKKR